MNGYFTLDMSFTLPVLGRITDPYILVSNNDTWHQAASYSVDMNITNYFDVLQEMIGQTGQLQIDLGVFRSSYSLSLQVDNLDLFSDVSKIINQSRPLQEYFLLADCFRTRPIYSTISVDDFDDTWEWQEEDPPMCTFASAFCLIWYLQPNAPFIDCDGSSNLMDSLAHFFGYNDVDSFDFFTEFGTTNPQVEHLLRRMLATPHAPFQRDNPTIIAQPAVPYGPRHIGRTFGFGARTPPAISGESLFRSLLIDLFPGAPTLRGLSLWLTLRHTAVYQQTVPNGIFGASLSWQPKFTAGWDVANNAVYLNFDMKLGSGPGDGRSSSVTEVARSVFNIFNSPSLEMRQDGEAIDEPSKSVAIPSSLQTVLDNVYLNAQGVVSLSYVIPLSIINGSVIEQSHVTVNELTLLGSVRISLPSVPLIHSLRCCA
jgi:hypothetical protein